MCDKDHYYDHGTNHCESCSEICDHAKVMGTVEQCWSQCKAYAQIQWPEDGDGTPPSPVDEIAPDLDNVIYVLAVALPCLFIGVAVTLSAVWVCKRLRKRQPNPEAPDLRADQRVALMSSGAEGEDNRASTQPVGSQTGGDIPLSVFAEETEGNSGFSGLQEVGAKAGGQQAAGHHDWHIMPSPQASSSITNAEWHGVPSSQASSSIISAAKHPVQVSPEGNSTAFTLASSVAGHKEQEDTCDSAYDSTELKAVLQ